MKNNYNLMEKVRKLVAGLLGIRSVIYSKEPENNFEYNSQI